MIVIPYRITLLEPLLATRVAGDPNSAVSFPYVPGSTVRGAMVAAYMQEMKLATLDAGQEDAQRIFFDGRTRYLNAYPAASGYERMLPTPRSWFTVKGEESPVYDFAREIRSEIDDEPRQFSGVAGGAQPFCLVTGDEVCFHAPQRRVTVHTQRERAKGRATEDSGAVFQYEALAEGEIFAGYVLAEHPDDASLIASLLNRTLRLGGSSNSGYGRVDVTVEKSIDLTKERWREVPGSATPIAPGEPFVVTLLSNTLVRDHNTGQYTTDLKPALEDALGVALQTMQTPDALEKEQRSGWSTEEVGGFNRTWGLPLPQAQAISAGSVFLFTASEEIDVAASTAAEWRGIGERRAEGYGRLAINWQRQAELSKFIAKTVAVPASAPELTGVAQEMAETMAKRMLRRELDMKLRKRLNNLTIVPVKAISNAQLSRFRVIVRDALPTGDTGRLLVFLADIRERRSAREQFERARVSDQRLVRWLEERLNDPTRVWQDIGAVNLEKRLGSNVHVRAIDDQALAREYTIRLIDGLLAKAAQTRREQEEDER